MRKSLCLIVLVVVTLTVGTANPRPDSFTPLVVSPLTSHAFPFPGTDGRTHIVYELVLTNANVTPATLEGVEVIDVSNPSKALGTYQGQDLLSHLRTTGSSPADNATIEFNKTRLLLIDLDLDPQTKIPGKLLHRVKLLGATAPARQPMTPVSMSYTVAPLETATKLPHIGPPLEGKGWVAVNGCCGGTAVHRASSLSCNGAIYFSQRFAIDWMQLDSGGKLMNGDAGDVQLSRLWCEGFGGCRRYRG
jgi:hypothetical protein